MIVVSLFPLGVGPDPVVLRTIGPGVLWVAALLACLLSLSRVFTADYLDGALKQMVLVPQPLAVLVVGKVLAHWLISGLPVVLLSPLLGLQFGLSGESLGVLVMSLLLGTPTLSMIGAIGAAFSTWRAREWSTGRPPGASTLRSSIDFWSWRRHQQYGRNRR